MVWIWYIRLKLWPFLRYFCLLWPKFGCHSNVRYTIAIRNVFFVLVDHNNPLLSVIAFSLSLLEMHLYAFIAILVRKLGCRSNAPFPFCTRVSQLKSVMAQTLSQNKTLHGYVAYNWSYGHFCDFFGIFSPLDPCNQKCLLWIGRPRKLPVISNHILIISRRNVFVCIYSNFSPKIGCHGNAPLSLV